MPWQTAFSDFLTGSSKDLAKHVKLVVSVHQCSGPGRGAKTVLGVRSVPSKHTEYLRVFLGVSASSGWEVSGREEQSG